MKRLSKIITCVLLFAIALSIVIVFNVFAVGENTSSSVKTLFDLKNTAPKNSSGEFEIEKKVSTSGVNYYTVAYKDGWTVENGAYTAEPFIQIAPAKHYLKNGWRDGDTAEGVDDTDYLVIDFDISTDTNAFDQIFIQTLFYYGKQTLQSDGSYKGSRKSAQNGHYVLFGDSGEDAYFTVSNDDKNAPIPIDVQSGEEWAHLTMIVDATVDTGGMMHLYYNGQHISSRVCMTDDATYLESIRISLGTAKCAPDLDNESFSIANATIKSFPSGYTGELAHEKANLGSKLYPLSSFSDLKYCLSNLPENTVAKITHQDLSETLVTRISDLDGNLKAGDSVVLYRDIARRIVVPGIADGDTVVPAVSFELNGHSMVEPLALADYDDLDWIIRDASGELHSYEADGSTVYAKGAQEYTDGAITVDTLSAYVNAAFSSSIAGDKILKFTFLKDTSISYSAILKFGASSVTFDLNGNTLNIAGGKVPFSAATASARIVIRDGKLINHISNPLYVPYAASYYVVDVDLTANNSLCDQRAGTLVFINSKITASNTITSLKSHSLKSSYAVFDGCEIIIDGAAPISFSNLRTSSARRGSMNGFVGIYDTVISGNDSLVHANYYANEWQGGDAAALLNQNTVTISIQESSVGITGGAPVILAEIQSLSDLNNAYTFAEGFNATTNVYIDASDIEAERLVAANDDTAVSLLKKNGVTAGAYSANTNVTVRKSDIISGDYVFSNTVGTESDNGELLVFFYDGVRLTSKLWAAESDSAVNAEFDEGVKLAYCYDEVYPYIATVNWTESTLVGDRPDTTTVKLSPVFADGMVLQGHKEIKIYGSCATVGAEIEVTLGENAVSTTVGTNGKWSVTFPPMDYAKGLTLSINEVGLRFPETRIENVNIGEIWMISGQSNSVYGIYKLEDFEEYRSNADNFENIYAFAVNQSQSLVEKTETANSGWYRVDAASLTKDDRYSGISGIAYVMATRLATELGEDVPIGIIDINFNGSTVEAWMSPENLAEVDPELSAKYNAYRSYYEVNGEYPPESEVSDYGSYIASSKLYQKMACACYNAMIAPFFDGFSIRGTIWYQGEGNASSVTADSDGSYAAHFTGVRNTFRDVFADDELPVFIIQLPPRMGNPFYFRALQYDMAEKDPDTYVVLSLVAGSTYSSNELKYTSPAGDSMVHYERKSPVGLALADSVLENIYDLGELSAPKILSIVKLEGAIAITFDRDLTVDKGYEMLGFEIAGSDNEWYTASASYADRTVILTSDAVSEPLYVRYGAEKSILVFEDGTEIYHNKTDAKFVYDEEMGTVTITANGNVYVIDTSDPAVIGGRMPCNVVATNGSALPIFIAVAE